MKAMWNNPIWLSNLAECVPSPLVPRYMYEILWRYHRSIGEIGPQIGETCNLFLSPLPSIPKVRRLAEASAEGCFVRSHRKFSKGNTSNNFKNMFLNHQAILLDHSYWQKIVPIVWPPHQLTPRAARPGFLKTCNFVRKTLSDSGVIIRNSCMTMLVLPPFCTVLRLTAFHLSSWLKYSNALGFYVRSTWQLSTISFGLSIKH